MSRMEGQHGKTSYRCCMMWKKEEGFTVFCTLAKSSGTQGRRKHSNSGRAHAFGGILTGENGTVYGKKRHFTYKICENVRGHVSAVSSGPYDHAGAL